ncbi:MAG: DUF111 family protein, partial [Lachnospiraceae bacterium]|nr:DUF111 family protein [Lachnospiraceae bacterium]
MRKILYLDLGMGAAGDMLAASLFDLLPEEDRAKFLSTINAAGIPHTEVSAEAVKKSGVTGTAFHVVIEGHGEEGGHDHEHWHD